METVQWGSLPNELQAMPATLRIMQFVGLWAGWKNFYRFVLLFTLGTMDILFPKIFLGIGSSDVTTICKGIAELMFELSIYCTMVILVSKRNAFEKVIRGLDEIFREVTVGESSACYDMILNLNLKIKRVFRFLVVYCIYAPFAFAIPSFLVSHWRFWSGSDPLVFDLPMEQNFYGLQIRTNFLHYHIFMAISVAAYCVCAYFELIKFTSTCFMIKYSSLTYQLVAEKIRQLPKAANDSKTIVAVEDLKKVVELHRKAYNITDLIEEICQIPVALEFLFCIMVWCLNMIYISKKIDMNLVSVMIIFFLSLVHVFCYSYLGSELAEKAADVSKAVYDLPWYEHSAELQRYYRLMVQRTQRPTGITGVKFFVVERTTFFSVVQMAYSYYLVLKDVLNKL